MQDCELWKPRRDSLREFNEEEEQRERERIEPEKISSWLRKLQNTKA